MSSFAFNYIQIKEQLQLHTKQVSEVALCSSLGLHVSLLSGRIHCACSTYQAFHENAPSARIGPEIYIKGQNTTASRPANNYSTTIKFLVYLLIILWSIDSFWIGNIRYTKFH